MALYEQAFFLIILICRLCSERSLGADTTKNEIAVPSSIIIPNEWELISSGWPQDDYRDTDNGRKTQFYYVKDKSQNLEWGIKPTFVQQFKDESQIFKLSFKYWSGYKVQKPQPVVLNGKPDRLSDRYFPDFESNWMPCEYIMSYQNLTSFKININTGDDQTIVAFKDFKIEYETQSQNQKTETQDLTDLQKTEGFSLIGWDEYSEKDTTDFLYFSANCSNGCLLKSEGIDFKIAKEETVTKVELSFQYWMESKAETIQISNRKSDTSLNSVSPLWNDFNEELKDTNYNNIVLKITTVKTKLDDYSIVAIKDLKIKIYVKNSKNPKEDKSVEKDCSKKGCEWRSDQPLQWSQSIDHLKQSVVYYYPNSEKNSLEIIRKDDLSTIDLCFTISYWAPDNRDVKINVNFNVRNESVKDTILTIRPKPNKFERTHFCLRDLIAFTSKVYVISFNVKQNQFNDSINGFVMTIDEPTNTTNNWQFKEEVRTFLQPMKKLLENDEGLIRGEWRTDWKQLSPMTEGLFEFKEDLIAFTAIAESKTPASAQLTSQWIKYDSNLHLIDPQYSIKVSDQKLFNAIKVRPKVCDWLSHCTDVIQSIEINNQSLQVFSFKFSPFKYSKYIKLIFNIEYFQPYYHDSTPFEVKFNLTLIHFGDPCFTSDKSHKCENSGLCFSDYKKDVPNKLKCSCPQSWTGEVCTVKDYCGTKPNSGTGNQKSGSKYCRDSRIGGLECENVINENRFRCVCGTNDKTLINWDKDDQKCKALNPESIKWSGSLPNYYPTDASNSLKYKFTNINTTKFDVCLKLEYKSNQTVLLNVNYHYSKDIKLFSVSLPEKLTEKGEIEFCIRDFLYTVQENFELSLQISNVVNNSYGENTFTLTKFEPNLKQIINRAVDYINNWDIFDRIESNPKQFWRSIPKFSEINENGKNTSFNFVVSVNPNQTSSKSLLISDWINSSNFSNSENVFTIQYNKDAYDTYFNLKTLIKYEENDDIKPVEPIWLSDNGVITVDDFKLKEYKFSIPAYINSPFKLVFEITYFSSNKTTYNLDITFKSASVGDPCFKNKTNVCQNNGVCHGFGPNNYYCNCTDDSYGGKNCELQNYCKNNDKKINYKDFCESFPTSPDDSENKCVLLKEKSFECKCPENDYIWNLTTTRCDRKGYTKQVKQCKGKDCDIFDKILSDSKWSNTNMPKYEDKKLPFYISSKSEAQLKIQVNNIDNEHDYCFKFFYHISDSSNLLISYNNLKPIALSPTQRDGWFPEGNAEKICARSLVKDIDKSFNITFVAKPKLVDSDIIALHFESEDLDSFPKRNPKLLSELPFLKRLPTDTKDINYNIDNQWPLSLPHNQWIKNLDQTIQFKVSNVFGRQTSYLMSNWLMKDIDGYKLNFNITDTDFKNFSLQIIVYDTQMQEKQVSEIIIGDQKINPKAQSGIKDFFTIPIMKMSSSFRVAFKVDYELKSDEVLFILDNIDLGDPCVLDDFTENNCLGRGTCQPNGPVNDYKCDCKDGYTDINCKVIDFCNYPREGTGGMKGDAFCEKNFKGKCSNGGFGGFSCSCSDGDFWDFNEKKCKNSPKCILNDCDPETQDCEEPKNDPKAKYSCVCKDNYVNVSTGAQLKCEKLDVCNELHRNRKGLNPPKPCEKSDAKCFPLADTDNDYTCVCKKGFQKSGDKDQTSCDPLFCEFPSLNTCQQKCENDPKSDRKYKCSCSSTDFYNTNGDNCEPKSGKQCNCKGEAFCNTGPDDCMCKKGYNPVKEKNGTNIVCEPDPVIDVPKAICDTGKANFTNNKFVCECGSAYKLNEQNTCELKPICGKEGYGRKDCNNRNALCFTDETNEKHYKCSCPPGKRFENSNDNSTCIDYCSFGGRQEQCTKINAECDATESGIGITDIKKLCYCRNGYVWDNTNGEKCAIAMRTIEFSLNIKNTPNDQNPALPQSNPRTSVGFSQFSTDLNGYFNDIKSMTEENNRLLIELQKKLNPIELNKKLVATLRYLIGMTSFSGSEDTIAVKQCNLSSNFYNCIFTLSLKDQLKTYGNISLNQQLKNLCISYPAEPNNCFFPKPKPPGNFYEATQQNLYSIVIDRTMLEKSSVNIYKPCQSVDQNNNCPQYSNCVDDKDSDLSIFSCICDDKYFTAMNPSNLILEGGRVDPKAIKYECKVNNLCTTTNCPSTEDHGLCVQSLPHVDATNRKWIAPYYCSCLEKYNLTIDKTNKKSCTDVCAILNCNTDRGKCAYEGFNGAACVCKDGWSGDNCDVEHKASLGGWIAGIVILAVLVVVVSGVAFFFARKSRNSVSGHNQSGHPMDDYTGSSYRVGQSGAGQARAQPSYQGRDNQAFHRE